jgi:hypothetical protein
MYSALARVSLYAFFLMCCALKEHLALHREDNFLALDW